MPHQYPHTHSVEPHDRPAYLKPCEHAHAGPLSSSLQMEFQLLLPRLVLTCISRSPVAPVQSADMHAGQMSRNPRGHGIIEKVPKSIRTPSPPRPILPLSILFLVSRARTILTSPP